MMRFGVFLFLLRTTLGILADAFIVPLVVGQYRRKVLALWSGKGVDPSSSDDDAAEGGRFDLDAERQRLKALFSNGDPSNSDDESSSTVLHTAPEHSFDLTRFLESKENLDDDVEYDLPPPPPLTTIERERRMAEIEILKQLSSVEEGASADAAVLGLLWNLWYSQFGVQAMKELQRTDQYMGDPSKWKECEVILLKLVEDYGVYFCEPLNRLATLYYLQGRLNESYRLCRLILDKLKPWHIGALSGIVQVCIGLGKRDEARTWAERRLPSVGNPQHQIRGLEIPRRSAWVDSMIVKAQASLEAAEKTTRDQLGVPDQQSTGAAEERTIVQQLRNDANHAGEDAWQ